jgi:hypothetical protein
MRQGVYWDLVNNQFLIIKKLKSMKDHYHFEGKVNIGILYIDKRIKEEMLQVIAYVGAF